MGLNLGLVKLAVMTRTKRGMTKGSKLLLDYGDAFDVTLPVLASGAQVPMLGPMDRYMKMGSWGTEDAKATGEPSTNAGICTEGEPEAKRQRTELVLGGGEGEADQYVEGPPA